MFVGNEIELGIVIPMIRSRTNQVSKNKGNRIRRLWFKAMRFIRGATGVIMGVQIPLMIIDRRVSRSCLDVPEP